MTTERLVLDRMKDNIELDQARLDENLAWLHADMHRYFFSFNTEDAEALSSSVEAQLKRFPRY